MTDQELKIHHASLIAAALLGQASKEDVDEVAELLAEFSTSILSRAIPEGHVVVPKEPTTEMLDEIRLDANFTDVALRRRYQDMIAAAPAKKEGT